MNQNRNLFWLIYLSSFIRCFIATSIELGNDEVYYLSYAQHLQWNYFDHPPMVALLIRLSTFNLYFHNELFVRLGSIILAAINTALIFNISKKIKDEKAGFIAALLFTASPYCSIIAGVFILPDAPQLFFWILGIHLLIQIISLEELDKKMNHKLLLFGVVAGLCIMSKVHAVFLWIGFALYILLYKREMLSNIYLYISALISIAIVSPIIFWNIENSFITYTFHSNRLVINNGIHIESFLRELIGSIFYNNIINYFLFITTLVALAKRKLIFHKQQKRILLLLSIPLILILFFISLFRDTLPHWSGPAYTAIIIITAYYVSDYLKINVKIGRVYYRLINASAIFLLAIVITGLLVINYLPNTIGDKDDKTLGSGDFTLDMYGWKDLQYKFKTIYDADINASNTTTTFIINDKWFPAAHIDNYIAQPMKLNFIAIGDLEDIHNYAWLNTHRKKIKKADDAYFITTSNNFCNPVDKYKTIFEKINEPIILPQKRAGNIVRNVYVYLMKNYLGDKIE